MPNATYSDAVQEAYASAPAGVVELYTLEIWHPTFDAPVRVVRNFADEATWVTLGGADVQAVLDAMPEADRQYVGLVARPEITAKRDPGVLVPWIALGFELELPEINPAAEQELILTMDNVGQEITDALDKASISQDPTVVIFRSYLSTDIEGPQTDPPFEFTLAEVEAPGSNVTARAKVINPGDRAFPGFFYTTKRFPMLAR
jgi:hypothetical protein